MFINSFKVNRGFRPLIQHLNYTAAWPLSTEIVHSQQTGRNQSIQSIGLHKFTLLAQCSRLDSQMSQSTRPTGHNVHAQRKEQNHQDITSFRGTQLQHISRRLETQSSHTLTSPRRLHVKAAKTRTLHRPHNKTCDAGIHYSQLTSQKGPISSCPSRQAPLQIKSLPLKIPASAAYLNSHAMGRFTPVAASTTRDRLRRPQVQGMRTTATAQNSSATDNAAFPQLT